MADTSKDDFDRLCRSIEESVHQISKVVGRSINAAGDAVGDAIENAVRDSKHLQKKPSSYASAMTNQQTSAVRARFRSTTGLTVSGIVLTAVSGIGIAVFGLAAITSLLTMGLFGSTLSLAGVVGSGVAAGISVWGLSAGIKRLNLASTLKAFKRIFGNREVCSIDEVAHQVNMTPQKTLSATRKILKYGLIPQGKLTDDGTYFIVTDDMYKQYQHARELQRQRELEQREEEAARLRAKSHHAPEQLSADDRAFIEQGRAYVSQLHDLDIAIDDPQISAKIVSIESLVERILKRVEEEPAVTGGLGRMMDYYLPTTVKLLAAYEDLEEQPVQGQNITSARMEIEQTLDTLIGAYEKLFDGTYQDLSMDVTSDITVLTAVLAQEGLTESPFDQKK